MRPEQIETLLPWSAAVRTKVGTVDRMLRKGEPTPAFLEAWRYNREHMKRAGVQISEDRKTKELVVLWWQPVPDAVLAAERNAVESSYAADADIILPTKNGLEYYPYQKAGVKYILDLFAIGKTRCLLGDDMGLGKTPQAIAVLNCEPKIQRVLIICKAGLKGNWAAELGRWLTRKMSIGIVETGCFPSTDIVIISFEMCPKFTKSLTFMWDIIIIDEVHKLKDPKSLRTRHIFGCKSRKPSERMSQIPTRRKLAITGTPIPNNTMDMWPVLHWLDPVEWNDQFRFGLDYCNGYQMDIGFGKNKKKVWMFKGCSKAEQLRERLRRWGMVRRLKRDVAKDLPPKTRMLVELENGGSALNSEWGQMLAKMKRREEEVIADLSKDQFLNLASMAEDDLKVAFKKMSAFRHAAAVAKVAPFVEDLLERMEELEKLIIFAHHIDCVQLLLRAFAHFNPVTIVGGEKDPFASQTKFQTDPSCRMIIGSDSMMEGFNLTAASTVAFFEADWVPGNLTQKEDRANRLGQKCNVLCLYYVLQNSLDARMIAQAMRKQESIDRILDREGASIVACANVEAQPVDAPTRPAVQAPVTDTRPAQLALFQ